MNSILATIQGKLGLDSGHNVNIPVSPVNTPSPHFESEHIYNATDADEVFDALWDLFKTNNVMFVLIVAGDISRKFIMYDEGVVGSITEVGITTATISIGTGIDTDGKTYYFINLEPVGSN